MNYVFKQTPTDHCSKSPGSNKGVQEVPAEGFCQENKALVEDRQDHLRR